MHSSLTAVVLCILAQAATAQCSVDASSDRVVPPLHSGNVVKAQGAMPTVMPARVPARAGGEIIASAAAGTYQPVVMVREAPVREVGEDEHHRRSGPAMLLAALALMCGIVLRRSGTR